MRGTSGRGSFLVRLGLLGGSSGSGSREICRGRPMRFARGGGGRVVVRLVTRGGGDTVNLGVVSCGALVWGAPADGDGAVVLALAVADQRDAALQAFEPGGVGFEVGAGLA